MIRVRLANHRSDPPSLVISSFLIVG